MTESKRFELIHDHIIHYDGDYFNLRKQSDIRSLVKVIGYVTDEKDAKIKELRETIDTIEKDYEANHGMNIRNAEWFTDW